MPPGCCRLFASAASSTSHWSRWETKNAFISASVGGFEEVPDLLGVKWQHGRIPPRCGTESVPPAGARAGPPPCLRGPKPPIRRAGAPGRIPARCPATAQTWAAVMPPGYAPSRPPSDWTRSTRAGFARTGCCSCSPRQHTHVRPARQCSFPRPAQINSPA